jgi:hypothetical protein
MNKRYKVYLLEGINKKIDRANARVILLVLTKTLKKVWSLEILRSM